MKKTTIHPSTLSKTKRLLYMTHMAIGDYVYQRMFLKKLKEIYPELKIDLWFDNCSTKEESWNLRRSQTLTEWFTTEQFLDKLYPVAASLKEREEMIVRAQQEEYDVIVFLVDFWCEDYARVARKISKNAYVIGTLLRPHRNFSEKYKVFKACDKWVLCSPSMKSKRLHITEFYQRRFEKLLGLKTTKEDIFPHLDVPDYWLNHMREYLENSKREHKAIQGTVFINYLSTNEKRDWSFEQARELILRLNDLHAHWTYILNLPPNALSGIQDQLIKDKDLKSIHVIPFSAQKHFYELPALIQLSSWVFSVETAIIHLASALSVPQIALVRKKAITWAPLSNDKTHILFTKTAFHPRIKDITVDEVMLCYKEKIEKSYFLKK